MLVPFAVSPSCGSHRPAPSAPPTMAPGGGTDPIQIAAVEGSWHWSHRVDEDGVRRIETEHWQLTLDGTAVTGTYDRRVTFLSSDGQPFDCSQTLTYELVTRYAIRGTAHHSHLELVEDSYRVEPSPCEGGYRKLGRYEGFLKEGQLLLVWKGGSQRLSRAEAVPDAEDPRAGEVVGRWAWHNSGEPDTNGEVRVEREDWELSEDRPGRVLGTYLRVVTVYDPDGRTFPCSGASHYRYTDRYTIEAQRRGDRLVVTEVAVDPEAHPCLARAERHLDQAIGRIRGSYLELTWRGGHRQVLHRN